MESLAQQHGHAPADLIIHAAVQLTGMELADVSVAGAQEALRAKVTGIWRVLGVFPRTDSCRVILCSSISATIGGRGMIVYAAANRMLDATAHRLRADGIDCISVQWGHWTVSSDRDAAGMAKLGVTGLHAMRPGDALALEPARLAGNAIIAAFDLARARLVLETCGRSGLLARLAAPAAERTMHGTGMDIPGRMIALLAEVIGTDDAGGIDTTIPLVALGVDSLQALDFRRRVKEELGRDLAVSDLLGGAPVAEVLARAGRSP